MREIHVVLKIVLNDIICKDGSKISLEWSPQNIKHRYVKKYQILYLPVNFVNSSVEINIQTTMKTKDEGDCGFISYFSQHSWFLWRLIILIHKHSLPVLLDSIFELQCNNKQIKMQQSTLSSVWHAVKDRWKKIMRTTFCLSVIALAEPSLALPPITVNLHNSKTADVFLVASDIIISLSPMNETPVYFTEEKGHFKIRQLSNTWIIRLKKVLLVASAIFG